MSSLGGDAAVCPAAFSDSLHCTPQLACSFSSLRGHIEVAPERCGPLPFWPRGRKTPREPPSPLQRPRPERVPLFPVPTCPPRNVPWGPGRRVFKATQNWTPTAGPITQPLQLGKQGQRDRRSQRAAVRKKSSDVCKAPSQDPGCSRCLVNDASQPKPNRPGAASAGRPWQVVLRGLPGRGAHLGHLGLGTGLGRHALLGSQGALRRRFVGNLIKGN